MTANSFVSKMRDAMFSLSRSTLVPKSLPDDLIAIFVNEGPPPQMRGGQLLPPKEWAILVAQDAARMYNVDWNYTADIPF
jgi:hypothetical protein